MEEIAVGRGPCQSSDVLISLPMMALLPGDLAPDFTLASMLDRQVENLTLSSLRGQYIMLLFYPVAYGYVARPSSTPWSPSSPPSPTCPAPCWPSPLVGPGQLALARPGCLDQSAADPERRVAARPPIGRPAARDMFVCLTSGRSGVLGPERSTWAGAEYLGRSGVLGIEVPRSA